MTLSDAIFKDILTNDPSYWRNFLHLKNTVIFAWSETQMIQGIVDNTCKCYDYWLVWNRVSFVNFYAWLSWKNLSRHRTNRGPYRCPDPSGSCCWTGGRQPPTLWGLLRRPASTHDGMISWYPCAEASSRWLFWRTFFDAFWGRSQQHLNKHFNYEFNRRKK